MNRDDFVSMGKNDLGEICKKIKMLFTKYDVAQRQIGVDVFGYTPQSASQQMTRMLDVKKPAVKYDQVESILSHLGANWDELLSTSSKPSDVDNMMSAILGNSDETELLDVLWPNWKQFSTTYQNAKLTNDKDLIKASREAAIRDIKKHISE